MGKQNDPDFEKEVLTSTEARNLLLMSFFSLVGLLKKKAPRNREMTINHIPHFDV